MKTFKPHQKQAAAPRGDVEEGDHIYVRHGGQPCCGRVLCHGRHGVTVDVGGKQQRVKWDKVLGHKQRVPMKFEVLEHGEDGMLVRDHRGRQRFINVPPEAREVSSLAKALSVPGVVQHDEAITMTQGGREIILFFKAHIDGYTRKDGVYVAPHDRATGHSVIERNEGGVRSWDVVHNRETVGNYPAHIAKKKVLNHHFETLDKNEAKRKEAAEKGKAAAAKRKETAASKKALEDAMREHRDVVDTAHHNRTLNFKPMTKEQFESSAGIDLHRSASYGKQKGSGYRLVMVDGKPAYARDSDHWGEFHTVDRGVWEKPELKEGDDWDENEGAWSKRHHWSLDGAGQTSWTGKTRRYGYVLLEDLKRMHAERNGNPGRVLTKSQMPAAVLFFKALQQQPQQQGGDGWTERPEGDGSAQVGQHVAFRNGEHRGHGKVAAVGEHGVTVADTAGGEHRIKREQVTHHWDGEGDPDKEPPPDAGADEEVLGGYDGKVALPGELVAKLLQGADPELRAEVAQFLREKQAGDQVEADAVAATQHEGKDEKK